MNYTNKDYYDYITKIDNIDSPLHVVYQKMLKLLLKEGLDKPVSQVSMDNFFKLFEVRKYQLKEKELGYLDQLLYFDAAFRRIIKNDRGSYSIYPKLKELPTTNDLLQYYSLGLKMDVKEIIEFLEPSINEKKEEFKKSEMEDYYGTPKYLILRTKAVYDAVTLLNHRNDIEDKSFVSNALSNVRSLLEKMLHTLGLENHEETYSKLEDFRYELSIDKAQYDFVRACYIEVLEQENSLIDISNQVWQSYSLENNGVLIHQLTQDAVESDQMEKICTSFYSDHTNTITDYSDANIGYAYPMNIQNTFAVSDDDAGSWEVTKEEFIERGIPDSWQLDGTNLWYEYPYHSKLFPPEYIEGQVLHKNRFAEIIIDNRKHNVKPLYCFYTPNASIEQIQEINDLASKQGLEVRSLKINEEDKKTAK